LPSIPAHRSPRNDDAVEEAKVDLAVEIVDIGGLNPFDLDPGTEVEARVTK